MLATGTLLFLFVCLVVLGLKVLCTRKLRGFRPLPGPRAWPFFGSVLSLDRARPYETFTRWSYVYGDIYQCRLFGQTVVVLSGAAAIQEAFGPRGRDFSGRPRMFFRAAFMSDNCQDIVSASPSPAWHALRRTVQKEMRRFDPGLDRLERLTGAIMEEMMEEFSRRAGDAFDPRECVYDAIMGINCLFLAGEKFCRDSIELRLFKRLERIVTESMSVGGRGFKLDMFPWLRFFGNATYQRLQEAKTISNILYEWLKSRVERDLKSGITGNGVVHGLFSALASAKPELSETNVKLAIVNLLIGGSSATTAYLYLLIDVLAQYPEVQQRLCHEADKVVGHDRRVSLGDRDSMPYSRAFLLELLRFGSLSPILIPHMTLVDTSIGEHRIPAGVQVFLNVRAVHHDPTFWKDPYAFQPERFLDASGCLVTPEDERRKRILSFGGGPRVCPGEQLALSRLFLAVVTIAQRFAVETPDGTLCPASCDPRTYGLGLVLHPRSYKVRFISRVAGQTITTSTAMEQPQRS